MRIYKWEKLKNEAACVLSSFSKSLNIGPLYGLLQSLEQQITREKIKNWRENTKEMVLKAQKMIDNWDIRCAGKLFEVFPSIISKKYHNKSFNCEYNERGQWIIIFD